MRAHKRWCLRAEEDTGDLGRGEPFGDEQRDVHPQPAARFPFALHLGDEALAFFRGNGDILHVRPFLWWLVGFGVFTMPQRTAVCSIILCIYLGLDHLEVPHMLGYGLLSVKAIATTVEVQDRIEPL